MLVKSIFYNYWRNIINQKKKGGGGGERDTPAIEEQNRTRNRWEFFPPNYNQMPN